MKFLDISGVTTLWNKIKEYVGTETKKYLPLSGGTMTGQIACKTPNNTFLYSITTQGNVSNNEGTGWISCANANNGTETIIQGGAISVESSSILPGNTINARIEYKGDNIHFKYIVANNNSGRYKFNLQKLIDDGYLIEE